MRALGKSDLPRDIAVQGETFRLSRAVKHDFFAATGFYDSASGERVVLKVGRTEDFAGVPLAWLGRRLCRRELRFYQKLRDVMAVPRMLGTHGPTGFILEFVPGTPLTTLPQVSGSFFRELGDLFSEIHRRNLAYVDTDKSQNILCGADGHPHLIDFQISFDLAAFSPRWLGRLILRHLRASDIYHLLKHKARLRPDQLTAEEQLILQRRSLPIRIHRVLFKPYFDIRRRTFKRLRNTGRLLPEGSK